MSVLNNMNEIKVYHSVDMMDNDLVDKQTLNEMFNEIWRNGFRWTPELVNCLRYYANHRDQYKTLGDYYPEIAKCLGQYITAEATRMQNALK